jgi:threonine dehydratase
LKNVLNNFYDKKKIDLDACIIPVGGGGLLAGTALAIKNLKPDVQVIVSI